MVYSKKSVQGVNYYSDPEIEKFRYNPYRKANRVKADRSYITGEGLDFPLHVIVEPTNRCNAKCGFCNREVMTRPVGDMDLGVYKKVIDQCAEGLVHSVSLYALGEPMLHKDIVEMAGYAKGRGIPYVDVSTNGMIDFRGLLGTGINEIIVSLDGSEETHEKLRQGTEYDKIFNNLLRFTTKKEQRKQRFPIVRAQMIDIPETKPDQEEYIEFWKQWADVIYIKTLETMSQNLGDRNLPQGEIDKRLKLRKPCKQLYYCLTVNSNGDIAYCCHDPKGKSVLGNIREMTLKEAWEKEGEIREKHEKGDYTELCSKCTDYEW